MILTTVRRAFTIVELLVVIAVIGILVAMLMPAVQQARSAARRTQCTNNLKQIALAAHTFHDVHGSFPPARLISIPSTFWQGPYRHGLDEPSWPVRLLPFLEQESFHKRWDEYELYHLNPEEARNQPLPVFLCPDRHSVDSAVAPEQSVTITFPCGCQLGTQTVLGGAVIDYVANHGDLSPGAVGAATDFYWGGNGTGVIISSGRNRSSLTFERGWSDKMPIASIIDGTSNTLLFGEPHVPRGKENTTPYDGPGYYGRHLSNFARIGGPGVPLAHNADDQRAHVYSFGSPHAGVVQFAFADGSVRAISTSITTRVLGQLTNRSDGTVLGEY